MRQLFKIPIMQIVQRVIKWLTMIMIVVAPLVLCYSWMNWTKWTSQRRHEAMLEFVNSKSRMSPEMLSRGSDHLSNVYTTFTAFVAAITVLIGCLTFVSWWLDYSHRCNTERDENFKEIQLTEMSRMYDLINEYDRAVVALKWNGLLSYKVIGYLYDKYRIRELTILRSGGEIGEKRVQLKLLDEEFVKDADDAGILGPASVLFRILNWIYAHESYLQGLYGRDSARRCEIEAFRARLFSLLGNFMTEQTKFVLGKYRHHRYHLEEHRHVIKSKDSKRYRGAQYADRLLLYERTLALLDPKTLGAFINALGERYEVKECIEGVEGLPLFFVEMARCLQDDGSKC